MAYIAFMDLLGTKNLMLDDTEEYGRNVRDFNRILRTRGGRNSRIYAFSDCAYLENENLMALLDTMDQIRDGLMVLGRFFTAAVSEGSLEAAVLNPEDNGEVHGFSFSAGGISKVYVMQSSMKGIGIQIDRDIYKKLRRENTELSRRIVCNYYISNLEQLPAAPPKLEAFYDLLMLPSDAVESNMTINLYFSYIIGNYMRANIRSPRYGRYYLSPVINLLNAFTFTEDDFELSCDGSITCKYDAVNYFFSDDKKIGYLLKQAIGFEYIPLVLLNRIIDDFGGKTNQIIFHIIKNMMENPIINSYISNTSKIPENLCSKKNNMLIQEGYYKVLVAD